MLIVLLGRIDPPPVCLNSLSFKERLRLEADERRHQAALRSVRGEKKDSSDSFADLNRSLACVSSSYFFIFLSFSLSALLCPFGSQLDS